MNWLKERTVINSSRYSTCFLQRHVLLWLNVVVIRFEVCHVCCAILHLRHNIWHTVLLSLVNKQKLCTDCAELLRFLAHKHWLQIPLDMWMCTSIIFCSSSCLSRFFALALFPIQGVLQIFKWFVHSYSLKHVRGPSSWATVSFKFLYLTGCYMLTGT
jgi:hypothetical protein